MYHWSRRPGLSGALGSRLLVVLGVAVALVLPDCQKSPTAPTPVTTPSPTHATVTFSFLNAVLFNVDHPPFNWTFTYTMHVVESGGVGCNLNYIHLDFYKADGTFLERTALGPEAFTGSNRLEAGATRDFRVVNGFNSDPFT